MKSFFKSGQIFVLPSAENALDNGTGKNARHILLVLSPHADESQLDLLKKILEAVKIDLEEDIFLVQLNAKQHFGFSDLCRHQDISTVLSFGFPMEQMGLQLRLAKYVPQRIQGKVFLLSDPLADLLQKRELKLYLWEALQSIFLQK